MFPQIAFGFVSKYAALAATSLGTSRGIGWPSQLVPSPSLGISEGFGEVVSAPPTTNTLLDKTLAYWTFDDDSDNLIALEEVGDYRFYFRYGESSYTTGLVGNAVTTPSGTGDRTIQTLAGGDLVSDRIISPCTDGSFIGLAFWVNNFTSTSFPSTDHPYSLSRNSSGHLHLEIKTASSLNYSIDSDDFISSDLDWHLIGLEIDVLADTYKIRFDETPVVTLTTGDTEFLASSDEILFRQLTDRDDAIIDRLHFYTSPLTTGEWTYLYDAGAGTTTYPFSDFV
jgi:hypothetical protein